MDYFTVDIVTPLKHWSFDTVISCTAPGTLGSFEILLNHAPLINQIEIGEIKIVLDGETRYFATSGGFLEVLNNKVSLVLETCEEASQIDVERAKKAAERARERLKKHEPNTDITRAEIALSRALNRLKVVKRIHVSVQ